MSFDGHKYSSAQGISRIIGMILKYRKDNGIEEVKLQIPEGAADEKKTLIFFSLLQEVFKFNSIHSRFMPIKLVLTAPNWFKKFRIS